MLWPSAVFVLITRSWKQFDVFTTLRISLSTYLAIGHLEAHDVESKNWAEKFNPILCNCTKTISTISMAAEIARSK